MFTTHTSERIFTNALDNGYIRRQDWLVLMSELVDETTLTLASRLMHAVRRGRLTIID